jgi:hypothetical protein
MAVVAYVVALLAFDAATPGDELGPPVTEETEPHAGEDLEEEPARPPGADPSVEDDAPDAARPAVRPRTVVTVDAAPSPVPTPATTPDAGHQPSGDRAGRFLLYVIIALAAAGAVLIARARR